MSQHMPIVMFCALPASGKSETRRMIARLTKEQTEQFKLGQMDVQVDDYPYVDIMRKIDIPALQILGEAIFYDKDTQCFITEYEWGTLAYMINDDYFDIKKLDNTIPEQFEKDPAQWLMDRIDEAGLRTKNIQARFQNLKQKYNGEKWDKFKESIQEISRKLLHEKYSNIPKSLEGKTVVFEFARGGPKGASFPLQAPQGYDYTLSCFDEEILKNAAILYVWVTPEQSYNKNIARGQESNSQTKSTQLSLNHSVPHNVMVTEYGCDDIDYLLSLTDGKTLRITNYQGKTFNVKCGRIDNRDDKTSCFRKPYEDWKQEEIERMYNALKEAFNAFL